MGAQHFGQRRSGLDVKTDRAGNERLLQHAFFTLLSFPSCDFSLLRRFNRSTVVL